MTDSVGVTPSGSGHSAEPAPISVVAARGASVPNAAPWWRCLHCGHEKYEEHEFTGHMKGVPMIHCANCKILHSPPDPNSKRALRWQIERLSGVLQAIAEWIEKRRGLNKSDRREALVESDDYSKAFATGALLELTELESFLSGFRIYASAIEARRAETQGGSVADESATGKAGDAKPGDPQ